MNFAHIFYPLLVCLQIIHLAVNGEVGSVNTLYKKLFTDNNADIRPLRNQTQVLYVDIFLHISTLVLVSEVDQRVEINCWVNLSWTDELRVWNSSEYGGVEMLFPEPGHNWNPRLLVTNSVDKIDIFEGGHTYHFLYANGTSRLYPSGVFRISCNMKMSYFPFDTQECFVRILTKYLSPYVKFRVLDPEDKDAAIKSFSTHGEWGMSDVTQTVRDEVFDYEAYSVFIVTFHLKRKPTFVVIVVLLPVVLLSMISLLVFLLPAESGEKVSFGITVLLSLSVFTSFVSDLLPRNSQSLPILVVYLFILMVLTGLAVVTTIIMMASSDDMTPDLYNHGNNNDEDVVKEMRHGTAFNAFADNHHGFDAGNLTRTSQRNIRSSFNNKDRNQASIGRAGRPRSPTSHINQWRSDDHPVFCQNQFYPESLETHTNGSMSNGRTHVTSDLDPGEPHPRRRLSLGTLFDKSRNSFRIGDSNHRKKEGTHKRFFSKFLIRIPRRDKMLFLLFFIIWLTLTSAFLIYSRHH